MINRIYRVLTILVFLVLVLPACLAAPEEKDSYKEQRPLERGVAASSEMTAPELAMLRELQEGRDNSQNCTLNIFETYVKYRAVISQIKMLKSELKEKYGYERKVSPMSVREILRAHLNKEPRSIDDRVKYLIHSRLPYRSRMEMKSLVGKHGLSKIDQFLKVDETFKQYWPVSFEQ